METSNYSSLSSPGRITSRSLVAQTENNATLWIGHLQNDPTEHFGGQTFDCPADGFLDNIQLFAETIPNPGDVYLTLHEFDNNSKRWGNAIAETTLNVQQDDREKWICFNLPPVQLRKSNSYGFRIHSYDALIGFGEACHDTHHPFSFGHEWLGSSSNQKGNYFSYFSLAFKVEMRA
jgi:hypothetical protein